MISRMFFSQEQFGGGFGGVGQKLGDQGRLRTLGTIERCSLINLTFMDLKLTIATLAFYC